MRNEIHLPVLLRETVAALACHPGGVWADGTIGAGGHAEAILRATAPGGRLLGFDRDAEILPAARRRLAQFQERITLRHSDHRQIPALLDELGLGPVDGVLLDLGVSSLQLDEPERGFSFRKDGPLDMRMDRSQSLTAAELVNRLPEHDLATTLSRWGEEPAARRMARAIAREREREPITTTVRLASILEAATGRRHVARLHPATRAFQALRIAVNAELEGLAALLEQAALRLRAGGRIVVIAFHSLEDRLVKRAFRDLAHRCRCPRDLPICGCGRPDILRLVTTRAVKSSEAERFANPRSRSARLRAAERIEAVT